jgi:CTP:molybdopterin cytidylyltransferase MocA
LIGGLVLAAGAGERFGGRKQVAMLDGRPLLEHVLAAMAAAPVDRVVVVLGAHAEEVLEHVPLHGAEAVVCEEWQSGMSASLRFGVEALGGCEAVVVVLGDQPWVSPEAVGCVVDARGDGAAAVRATYGGVPGHPVLLEAQLLARVGELSGDQGARALLDSPDVREVACDGLGSAADVDTPAALRRQS